MVLRLSNDMNPLAFLNLSVVGFVGNCVNLLAQFPYNPRGIGNRAACLSCRWYSDKG